MLSEGRIAATGTATDVLTEENISRYYRASVSVSSIDNTVVVAPKFKTTAKEPHGNRTDS